MTIRDTSIEAYHQIRDEGLLSPMRQRVLDVLVQIRPATSGEIGAQFPKSKGGRGEAGNVHARLNEMRRLGVVYEVRLRKCTVTEKNVIEWDVTGNLPSGSAQGDSPKKRELEAAVVRLEKRVRDLERENEWLKKRDEPLGKPQRSKPLSKPQHSKPLGKPQVFLPLGGVPPSKGPFG